MNWLTEQVALDAVAAISDIGKVAIGGLIGWLVARSQAQREHANALQIRDLEKSDARELSSAKSIANGVRLFLETAAKMQSYATRTGEDAFEETFQWVATISLLRLSTLFDVHAELTQVESAFTQYRASVLSDRLANTNESRRTLNEHHRELINSVHAAESAIRREYEERLKRVHI